MAVLMSDLDVLAPENVEKESDRRLYQTRRLVVQAHSQRFLSLIHAPHSFIHPSRNRWTARFRVRLAIDSPWNRVRGEIVFCESNQIYNAFWER
jgi:hypothetical protein